MVMRVSPKRCQRQRITLVGCGTLGRCLAKPLCWHLESSSKAVVEIRLIDDQQEGDNVILFAEKLEREFPSIRISAMPNELNEVSITELVENGDVVLVCVNNCKTRKMISDHATTLENITIISGSCDWSGGLVQTYVRRDGVDRSLPLANAYHPELLVPRDRISDDMTCPQSIVTSNLVAAVMLVFFEQVRINNFKTCFGGIGDYYVDGQSGKVEVRERPLPNPNASGDFSKSQIIGSTKNCKKKNAASKYDNSAKHDRPLGSITVIHGSNDGHFDFAGSTAGELRAALANCLNIPAEAIALVDGKVVDPSYRLMPNETLEFVKQKPKLHVGGSDSGDMRFQ